MKMLRICWTAETSYRNKCFLKHQWWTPYANSDKMLKLDEKTMKYDDHLKQWQHDEKWKDTKKAKTNMWKQWHNDELW